ncbi:MAG: hypothetical protein J7J42_03160 [Thermoplasmata archaeon]|nr:hypothetical protein [Thermoplasmata archaeon]
MKIVFRYRQMKSAIVGEIKRPVAEVYIRAKSGEWIEFHPFIDSGADITLIPYSFGLMLGLTKDVGEIRELKGVRGIGVPVIITKIPMRIGDIELEPWVAWALIEEAPPLLGRLGIFDRFKITFMEKEGKIIFEPVGSRRQVSQ